MVFEASESCKSTREIFLLSLQELHAHLNGSLRESTLQQLAKEYQVSHSDVSWCVIKPADTRTFEELIL
jgi:hypothetical protein